MICYAYELDVKGSTVAELLVPHRIKIFLLSYYLNSHTPNMGSNPCEEVCFHSQSTLPSVNKCS